MMDGLRADPVSSRSSILPPDRNSVFDSMLDSAAEARTLRRQTAETPSRHSSFRAYESANMRAPIPPWAKHSLKRHGHHHKHHHNGHHNNHDRKQSGGAAQSYQNEFERRQRKQQQESQEKKEQQESHEIETLSERSQEIDKKVDSVKNTLQQFQSSFDAKDDSLDLDTSAWLEGYMKQRALTAKHEHNEEEPDMEFLGDKVQLLAGQVQDLQDEIETVTVRAQAVETMEEKNKRNRVASSFIQEAQYENEEILEAIQEIFTDGDTQTVQPAKVLHKLETMAGKVSSLQHVLQELSSSFVQTPSPLAPQE